MPYTIQGNAVDISTEPILENDKHYVPLRELVEALGGHTSFEDDNKEITAVIGPWTATLTPDSTDATVVGNNQNVPVTLTAPPILSDGTAYVPFDFFRDAFGYQVSYDNDTVAIVNPNG